MFEVAEYIGIIALLVGLIIYILNTFDILNLLFITITFIFAFILRVIAFYKKWSIPII